MDKHDDFLNDILGLCGISSGVVVSSLEGKEAIDSSITQHQWNLRAKVLELQAI